MAKRMSLEVRGNGKRWDFHFLGDPKHLTAWREDGLNVMEIENIIPAWVVDLGLTRVWCIAQDLFHFKLPR